MQDYRYERKYYLSLADWRQVELQIRLHPAMFAEAYPMRWVNNIYFDSPGLANMYDNLDGLSWRTKMRIRWYGIQDHLIRDPTLEFKIKRGLLGRKEAFGLPNIEWKRCTSFRDWHDVMRNSNLPFERLNEACSLHPTLINRYRRRYFRSADHRYRITLDTELSYDGIRTHEVGRHARYTQQHAAIVEIKYSYQDGNDVDRITRHWPFRLTRSSKYVTGMQLVYKHYGQRE